MKKLSVICLFISVMLGQKVNSGGLIQPNQYQFIRYQSGMITIKLKEETGKLNPLDLSSIRDKCSRYGVNTIEKRFHHHSKEPTVRLFRSNGSLPDLSRIYKVTFSASYDAAEVAADFAKDSRVEYAEPIPVEYLALVPNDALYQQLQHLPQIMADRAWEIHKGEDGAEEVVIGIVDTGVDWKHPDLVENIWNHPGEDADGDGRTMEFIDGVWVFDPGDLNGADDDGNGYTDDLIGWNFFKNTNDPMPSAGGIELYRSHGTHCAGLASGRTDNGIGIASVSWNVKIMALNATDGITGLDGLYDAMIYAAENGADIISNSWGTLLYSQANEEAVAYVSGLGSLVVAAAQNWNENKHCYPASYPQVISVAAVAGNDAKTYYSNYSIGIDVAAPGGDHFVDGGILSTVVNGSYERTNWEGTSMATPLTAGVLGLMKSFRPDWNNEQLMNQLIATTDDIDWLNPDYAHLLGSGRVNAFRALTENPTLPQQLKLELHQVVFHDSDANGRLEAGEIADIDVMIRNYAHGVRAEDISLSLSTGDSDVQILRSVTSGPVLADGYSLFENAFQIQISDPVVSHAVEFSVDIVSDLPILPGPKMSFERTVSSGGIFVFEGVKNGRDYSGTFIRDQLQRLGCHVVYSTKLPGSFAGYDAVFLSLGNAGPTLSSCITTGDEEFEAIRSYLESGGKMYIEGGNLFKGGAPITTGDYQKFFALFGIAQINLTTLNNPIDRLVGTKRSFTSGMTFSASHQTINAFIESIVASSNGIAALHESNHGYVGIQYQGAYGQRTFFFAYALSELVDADSLSNRTNLLKKIVDFFGIPLPPDHLMANFIADVTAGPAPLTVRFTDLSSADPASPVTSRSWDFDGDGMIDSDAPDPVWTYQQPGVYSVRLIVSNGMAADTVCYPDYICTNQGVLVWEGFASSRDYSGAFIRDYLISQGLNPIYTTHFPSSLRDFDAVFLSFGNWWSDRSILEKYQSDRIIDYLKNAGHLYVEGGDAMVFFSTLSGSDLSLFGLKSVSDGFAATFPLDWLEGTDAAITHGMTFQGSNQQHQSWIDLYAPDHFGIAAFAESDHGIVAVQHEGFSHQRTFCFSYALAELADDDSLGTRAELLHRIGVYFDLFETSVNNIVAKPGAFVLCRNYPNPFNPQTTLDYSIPQAGKVALNVFNIQGQLIRQLVDGYQDSGSHSLIWDGTDAQGKVVNSGVYLYRLKSGGICKIGRMLLLK